jgi:hypothetical protein
MAAASRGWLGRRQPGGHALGLGGTVIQASPGRRCHSKRSLAGIAGHSLGIYMIILLPLLSCLVKMTASPRANPGRPLRRQRLRPGARGRPSRAAISPHSLVGCNHGFMAVCARRTAAVSPWASDHVPRRRCSMSAVHTTPRRGSGAMGRRAIQTPISIFYRDKH